jgi:hypothetical protein
MAAYDSPVESPEADDLATVPAEEFFEAKPAHSGQRIDAYGRGRGPGDAAPR